MAAVVLADDETQRIDRGNDEYPFGHTKLLTLDCQTCVQTEANNSISCNEKNPFRDLGCMCQLELGDTHGEIVILTMQSLPSIKYAIFETQLPEEDDGGGRRVKVTLLRRHTSYINSRMRRPMAELTCRSRLNVRANTLGRPCNCGLAK